MHSARLQKPVAAVNPWAVFLSFWNTNRKSRETFFRQVFESFRHIACSNFRLLSFRSARKIWHFNIAFKNWWQHQTRDISNFCNLHLRFHKHLQLANLFWVNIGHFEMVLRNVDDVMNTWLPVWIWRVDLLKMWNKIWGYVKI